MSEKVAVALVGGNHQIGIVALVAHHVRRRNDLAVGSILSVMSSRLDMNSLYVATPSACTTSRAAPFGISLGTKPPLAPTGTITAFLTCCAFTSPEHLGAEILRPVRPADAAARHLAEAQVHAFDARRIDEDLVQRARQRQAGQLTALELDRDDRLGLTVHVGLEEIGADRRLHGVDELPQDAVLVQALDRLQRLLDLVVERRLLAVAAVRGLRARIEADVEQFDDMAGGGACFTSVADM